MELHIGFICFLLDAFPTGNLTGNVQLLEQDKTQILRNRTTSMADNVKLSISLKKYNACYLGHYVATLLAHRNADLPFHFVGVA